MLGGGWLVATPPIRHRGAVTGRPDVLEPDDPQHRVHGQRAAPGVVDGQRSDERVRPVAGGPDHGGIGDLIAHLEQQGGPGRAADPAIEEDLHSAGQELDGGEPGEVRADLREPPLTGVDQNADRS